MIITKVLARKDAASIIVAVAMALIGAGVITALSTSVTGALVSGSTGEEASGFTEGYLVPLLVFAFQIIFLELSLRAIIFSRVAYLRSQ